MLNQWSPIAPLQNRTQTPTRKARAATFERRGRTQATKVLPFFCWSEMPRNAFYTVYVSFLVANRKTKVNKRETVQKYSVQTDLFLFSFFFGWTTWLAESYPQPGIKPVPLAVEAWSLNHWTIKEVPKTDLSFLGLHEALEISADFPRIFTVLTFVCIIFW